MHNRQMSCNQRVVFIPDNGVDPLTLLYVRVCHPGGEVTKGETILFYLFNILLKTRKITYNKSEEKEYVRINENYEEFVRIMKNL